MNTSFMNVTFFNFSTDFFIKFSTCIITVCTLYNYFCVGNNLSLPCLGAIVFLKEFFEKIIFEKSQQTTRKSMKNYPACKEFSP